MRRFTAFVLMFILAIGALGAQEAVPSKVKFLPLESMDLSMRYSSEIQRLYVQVDFDVETARLDSLSYWGVFLNKNAQISDVKVNGVVAAHYYLQGLVPEHFEPLVDAKYLQADAPANFVGIVMGNVASYPEKVRVKFSYFMPVPAFAVNEMKTPNAFMAGDTFWYPHYLNGTVTVNLVLATTPYFELMLGDASMSSTVSDLARTHQSTILDMPGLPKSFRLLQK